MNQIELPERLVRLSKKFSFYFPQFTKFPHFRQFPNFSIIFECFKYHPRSALAAISLMFVFLMGCSSSNNNDLVITEQQIANEAGFQSVSVLNGKEIWLSGRNGAIYRTKDGGENWNKVTPPENSESLQFRDIEVVDQNRVYIMSAGEGQDSRIYVTEDQGQNWKLLLKGTDSSQFFNCIDFVDTNRGWLYGDSNQGALYILATTDGGATWNRDKTIAAQAGEGGFASSGTCLAASNQRVVIGTGNSEMSRLIIKTVKKVKEIKEVKGSNESKAVKENKKNNRNWRVVETDIKGGSAAGIFTLVSAKEGIYAFGGSLDKSHADQPATAKLYTSGENWIDLGDPMLRGAIYGSAKLENHLFVSNPQGISHFQDSWEKISQRDTWAMECDGERVCWGVGKDGWVQKIEVE